MTSPAPGSLAYADTQDVGHPNGDCIHGLPPGACSVCLGTYRRPLPGQPAGRNGAPFLGSAFKLPKNLELRDNYEAPQSILSPSWRADGRGCGGSEKQSPASEPQPPFTVEVPEGFADLVRARFRASGLTYIEMARRIGDGCRPSSIQGYMDHRRRCMELPRYEALCRELGIEPTALRSSEASA